MKENIPWEREKKKLLRKPWIKGKQEQQTIKQVYFYFSIFFILIFRRGLKPSWEIENWREREVEMTRGRWGILSGGGGGDGGEGSGGGGGGGGGRGQGERGDGV